MSCFPRDNLRCVQTVSDWITVCFCAAGGKHGHTFEERLERGDLLQLDDIRVVVDAPQSLSPLGHDHDIVHLRFVFNWGWSRCNARQSLQ